MPGCAICRLQSSKWSATVSQPPMHKSCTPISTWQLTLWSTHPRSENLRATKGATRSTHCRLPSGAVSEKAALTIGGSVMEAQHYEEGVPSWVDMGSADLDRAKEF